MKRIGVLLVASLFALQGCSSMASYEKMKYDQLKRELEQYSLPTMEDKDPVLAGALNLVLGFGNAYLEQWGPFVANLLLWPISPLWGIPQAYIDAKTLNKKETLYFYEFGPGKQRLETAKQGQASPAPSE